MSLYDGPEPTKEQYESMKEGDTDYKTCGWCRHSSGVGRYSCTLSGSCDLVCRHPRDEESTSFYKVPRYNDKGVESMGALDIQHLIESYESDLEQSFNRIKRLGDNIETLMGICPTPSTMDSGEIWKTFVNESTHALEFPNGKVHFDFRDFDWTEECLFNRLPPAYKSHIVWEFIRNKEKEIESCRAYSARVEERISQLRIEKASAKDTPPLPDSRTSEHFNVDDHVMVWMPPKDNVDGAGVEWRRGRVVYGYRHQDGCVSFHFPTGCICGSEGEIPGEFKKVGWSSDVKDPALRVEMEKCEENIRPIARCGGAGTSIPQVLLESEYQYFAEHPDEWEVWITKACDKDFNGERIPAEVIARPRIETAEEAVVGAIRKRNV